MKHRAGTTPLNVAASFPKHLYSEVRDEQTEGLEFIEEHQDESIVLEAPTGTGKTPLGLSYLMARGRVADGPLVYVTPTKALVDQVQKLDPRVTVVYGRHEYPCLFYPNETLQADEIPCLQLMECPHRVDQETGETAEPGVTPCPYYKAKYEARHAKVVACTTAFYFYAQWFQRLWENPAGVVIDEAHRIADTIRHCLSFDITDYHLGRSVDLLKLIEAEEADILLRFLKRMRSIIRRRTSRHDEQRQVIGYRPTLLKDEEIQQLLDILMEIDNRGLGRKITAAVREGRLNPVEHRETLLRLEGITRNLSRYVRQLQFSLPEEGRNPLNYTYAFFQPEPLPGERVQHRLVVRAFYVAPIIKRILPKHTLAYSATIGDVDLFGYETGIRGAHLSLGSNFPVAHTRIFLPSDTPNLAVKERKSGEPTRVLRRIAKTCKRFARKGLRSLVVVVSNQERDKFLLLCEEDGLDALSYGNGITPKEAATRFKAGEGDLLVGTVANYGEGIDLPQQLAPVIFFLRPGYPSPDDPGTQFQLKRFGSLYWPLTNWRVMQQALQVRGRNLRSADDLGVTFFISQQFRRFLFASLPAWLQDAYKGQRTFDQCVKDAEELLIGK